MPKISMTVNQQPVSAEVEARTLLVHFIRDNLGLTGTHVGCDTSQCGACVVHVDGKAVKSCTMLALQAEGCAVTTIEGPAVWYPAEGYHQEYWQGEGQRNPYCLAVIPPKLAKLRKSFQARVKA